MGSRIKDAIEAFADTMAGFALPLLFILCMAVLLVLGVIGLWSVVCFWGLT